LAASKSAALLACRTSSAAVEPVGDSITANRSADGSASNSRSHATRYDVCHCSLFASSLALSDFVMVVSFWSAALSPVDPGGFRFGG
jgi:hypothetical protein